MANQEHVAILRKGVQSWNQWRNENPETLPDLSEADIGKVDLAGVDFGTIRPDRVIKITLDTMFELIGANLSQVNLAEANLEGSNFMCANLTGANLRKADLSRAILVSTNLSMANLSGADLSQSSLDGANLSSADMRGANLWATRFDDTTLYKTDLALARMSSTSLINVDMSTAQGLDLVKHNGPSEISINTIIRSRGCIPESFLRGVGIPPSIVEQIPALISSLKPIDYYSCFISYSNKDEEFAKRLHADLQAARVRCWFAPHDMRIGDRIRPRIDESIRLYDRLLLVLSQHSVASQWVEHEVETALGKELESKPNVLFPIRLDDKVMESRTGWASHIRLTRHIGDFTCWKNHDDYQQAFNQLLRDLKAEA